MTEDNDRDQGAQEEARPETAGGDARAQVAGAQEVGEVRQRRGEGRRVNLVHVSGGGYEIRLRDRTIQAFCNEFEDITRFQLPEGIQQQVRFNIVELGQAREYEHPRETDLQGDGPELRSISHPLPPLRQESLERVEVDLPDEPANSWQTNAINHLREEQARISDIIDMIERLGHIPNLGRRG